MSLSPRSSSTANSSSSDEEEPYEYHADDGIEDLERIVTRSTTQDPSDNVLTRLGTLSRTVSRMTRAEMTKFEIDPKDFDLQRVLKFLANDREEQGIQQKSSDVVFEDLTVIGKNTAAAFVQNVGTAFFPFIDKLIPTKTENKLDLSKMPKTRECVRGVTGFAAEGTMTLVLGRPGSGCSTFLKAIGGETQTYLGVEGETTYSGIPRDEMVKKYKNQLIYVPELDEHFPFLTVQQTLEFAIGCKTPSVRIDNVSRSQYISTIKDLYTVLFGLNHIEKTLVGNDFVRGISGGQRKRVSIAEAMATRGTIYCYDNATRGLDASTALEFVEALRTSVNIGKTTALVTAYQASESIYQLFDYITVLYLGRQVFFGPADQAVDYFVNMGFEKPPRQTSSEYLTAVTDPLERVAKPGFEDKVPNTADEFETYWRNSPEFAALKQDIASRKNATNAEDTTDVFKAVHQSEKQRGTSKNSVYMVNYFQQLRLCAVRNFYTLVNNKAYTVTFISVSLCQALMVGSSYYNTRDTTLGAFSRGGAIFYCLLFYALMALAEISNLFLNKPILNKQRGYTLYHPSAELVASQVVQIPVRALAVLFFSFAMYFLANLKREAGAFFAFMLFINLTSLTVNTIFVFLSSLCPDINAANGLTGLFFMAMIVYSSFIIQRPSMYWWFKWFSYMNPILYGFESMITMEFRGRMMPCDTSETIPYGDTYSDIADSDRVCGFLGAALSREEYPNSGNAVNGDIYVLEAFDYTFDHCWRNLGILLLLCIGVLVVNAILVEYYNPLVATSDKLLFIKGGHIPDDLAKTAGLAEVADESDPEKGASTEEPTTVVKKESPPNGSAQKLGSDDIFMWRNIDYVVPYEGKDRKLLDNVQGWVKPGTLTALMGESGAGKTTLLNVLSRRTDVGVVTGDLLINGHPLDKTFERRTGYVQQQDIHIAELTVRESLLFAARLRRPTSVSDAEKVEYVDQVMQILHMDDYADAVAGQTGFGLNVEQRKKLSIATELVAKPSLLLFLDEPTSGLDSQSSWAIVQVLRQLAAAGQAILCTIHQPSASLFEQFDRLLLLKRGGQMVYFGGIGKNSETVLSYFELQGGRKCLPSENSAEYLLEVIGAGATASVNEDWHEIWENSDECKNVTEELNDMIEKTSQKVSDVDSAELQSTFAQPYYVQFMHVVHRSWLQLWRDVVYIRAKFIFMVVAGLIHGFSFWKIKHTTVGMQNAMFATFMAMIMCAPHSNMIQARAIASRELFEVRESKSNTFHWSTLLLAQFLVEIPNSVVLSTLYFVAWYFPIQIPTGASVCGFWWLCYCIFFQLFTISFALAVVYFCPDLPSANILFGVLFNFCIGFCGIVQLPQLFPGFWKFMWRTSPLTYFVEAILGVVLHDREVVCSSNEYDYLDPPSGQTCGDYLEDFFLTHSGYVNNPDATSNCAVCQYKVGDEYLASVGMSVTHRWRDVGLFCAYILFNLTCMLGLYYIFRVQQFKMPELRSKKLKVSRERASQQAAQHGAAAQQAAANATMATK